MYDFDESSDGRLLYAISGDNVFFMSEYTLRFQRLIILCPNCRNRRPNLDCLEVPSYMHNFPSPGVVLVPLADLEATWDFLVVWQRGRTASAVKTLIDALACLGETTKL
jgi:hypothetical protein